ncbi:hypothetical protein [Nannocystis pusilla]|uniref:hypothetical protein n=1 Tax=Nannocystis pusilla TaxID=889268 RepID=UPI003DA5FE2C
MRKSGVQYENRTSSPPPRIVYSVTPSIFCSLTCSAPATVGVAGLAGGWGAALAAGALRPVSRSSAARVRGPTWPSTVRAPPPSACERR